MSRMGVRLAERCLVLHQICEGLLTRIWALKAALADQAAPIRRYPSVHREDWSKIRKKIESSFPEIPEIATLSKLPGFDALKSAADDVIKENVEIFALLLDSMDFKTAATEVLYSVFGSRGQYSMARAPQVLGAAMDLLVGFCQLHLLWALVEERKAMVLLFMCAHHIKNDHRNDVFYSRIKLYVDESSTGLKWLTQQFSPISLGVGDLLLELADAVRISLDATLLRQLNAFSLLDDGAAMALPAKRPLSARSPRLQLHVELTAAGDRYAGYVLWGGLVCPGELYREGVVEIFKTMAAEHALLPIFRDQSLDVQSAVEEVCAFFPPKGYVLPPEANKDLKPKKSFKDFFKPPESFFAQALQRHRERASYLSGELANMVSLAKAIPGLLAPKLPMVLALAALAKSEVLWALRHGTEGADASKRQGKKAAAAEKEARMSGCRLVELVGLLDALCSLTREHSVIIRQYYAEFLQGAHRAGLPELVEQVLAKVQLDDEAKEVLQGLDQHLASAAFWLPPPGPAHEECPGLKAVRVGWTRVLPALTKAVAEGSVPAQPVDALCDRMTAVVATCSYLDCLDPLLERAFLLHPTWWFREGLVSACRDVLSSLAGVDEESWATGRGAEHVLAVVRCLDQAGRNAHPSYAEEERLLREQAVEVAAGLVGSVVGSVELLVSDMADNILRLFKQVSPVEALLRMERAQASKTPLEPLPGRESCLASGFDSSPVVRALMRLQLASAQLLQSVNRCPELRVAHRCFFLRRQVSAALDAGLSSYIESCFDTTMTRPSVALSSILCFVRALQRVAHHVDVDVLSATRKHLLEAGWISSSGQAAQGDATAGPQVMLQLDHTQALSDQSRPIGRLSAWFMNFLEALGSQTGSSSSFSTDPNQPASAAAGQQPGGPQQQQVSAWQQPSTIFVASRRTFISYRPPGSSAGAGPKSNRQQGGVPPTPNTASQGVEAELFTDINELHALVELVGPLGVEVIDADLLAYMHNQLLECKAYLDANAQHLSYFRANFIKITPDKAVPTSPPPERLLQALSRAGNALALRQLLYSALADVQAARCPSLSRLVNNAYRSVAAEADATLAEQSRALAGFDRLARFSAGDRLPTHDIKLANCLDQVTNDWHVWAALVPAVALSFTSEWWREAAYVLEHDAFSGNQQLALRALADVLRVMKAKSSSAASEKDRLDVKALGREFVASSSFVLLRVKQHCLANAAQQEGRGGGGKANTTTANNIHTMLIMLEKFSEWFPDVDRGTLEAHLPYAMLHNAHMELALERQQQASGGSNNSRGGGPSSSDEPVGLGGGRAQVVKPLAFLEEENALAAAASN